MGAEEGMERVKRGILLPYLRREGKNSATGNHSLMIRS